MGWILKLLDQIQKRWYLKLYQVSVSTHLAMGDVAMTLKAPFSESFYRIEACYSQWNCPRGRPQNLSNENSASVQVMIGCRKATSHYLSQWWPRFKSPYSVINPEWVPSDKCFVLWILSCKLFYTSMMSSVSIPNCFIPFIGILGSGAVSRWSVQIMNYHLFRGRIELLLSSSWWRHQMVAVNSPHKGQWRGALMFSLIWAWINGWVNNREAGDLRRHRAHYDVLVMSCQNVPWWRNDFSIIYICHHFVCNTL